MCTMWPCEVVEPLPFVEFGFDIDVILIAKELIELLLIGSMRSFHLAVQLRRTTFDVGVSNTFVFNVPMDFRQEFMAIVSSNFANAEKKLVNDMIDEVDRVCLRVFVVDLECPDKCRIVDCGVLEPTHLLAAFPFKGQKFDVYLDVMTRYLFLIPFGVQFTHPRTSGQAVEAVTSEGAINPGIRDFDVVIARQVPNDPNMPQMILAAQIQNFLDDLRRCLIGGIFRNWLGLLQVHFSMLLIGIPPPLYRQALRAMPIFSACWSTLSLRRMSRSSFVMKTSSTPNRGIYRKCPESPYISTGFA